MEAREFLLHQPSLPGLEVHEGLNASAREHAADLANNGLYGHIGSDNSTFRDRIVKHCRRGPGMMAEIIGADFLMPGRNHA